MWNVLSRGDHLWCTNRCRKGHLKVPSFSCRKVDRKVGRKVTQKWLHFRDEKWVDKSDTSSCRARWQKYHVVVIRSDRNLFTWRVRRINLFEVVIIYSAWLNRSEMVRSWCQNGRQSVEKTSCRVPTGQKGQKCSKVTRFRVKKWPKRRLPPGEWKWPGTTDLQGLFRLKKGRFWVEKWLFRVRTRNLLQIDDSDTNLTTFDDFDGPRSLNWPKGHFLPVICHEIVHESVSIYNGYN